MLSKIPTPLRPIARLFILQQFFSTVVLLFPVYILAMNDFGFAATTISSLMSLYYLVGFVFEIPSGVWADQFSRRKVLLQAEIVCIAAFAIIGLFPTVIGFAVGLALWSLRSTMYSGTYDAYMYDELAYYDGAEHFGLVRSQAKIAQWAGVTLSSIGILVYHDFGWQIVASISVAVRILSFWMLYKMPEVGKVKPEEHIPFKTQFVDGFKAMRERPIIAWIGLYSCSYGLIWILFEYRALLAKDWSLSPLITTVFVAGCSGALCLGSYLSTRWHNDGWSRILSLGLAIATLMLAAFASHWGILSAALFLIGMVLYQLWLIRSGVMLQHATPSAVRATTGSIVNFTDAVLSIALVQFLGWMAGDPPHYLPAAQILSFIGFVLALGLLVFYGLKKRA
ncbi:MAG TPA: MFS transporter [Alphaproteobacteria bacterium]